MTLSITALTLVLATAPTALQDGAPGPFRPLFNGTDLDGWEQKNGDADYRVEDACIVGTTAEGSPNSFLCTTEDYGDFVLMFRVKVDPRLNSGVQIRSESTPEYQDGRVHGYQVEIDSDGDAGYVYDEARRGWLSTERDDQVDAGHFRVDDWNHYVVICQGDRIQTFVNSHPVADLNDDMTPSGFIGLQVHAFGGDSPAEVRWADLYLLELD